MKTLTDLDIDNTRKVIEIVDNQLKEAIRTRDFDKIKALSKRAAELRSHVQGVDSPVDVMRTLPSNLRHIDKSTLMFRVLYGVDWLDKPKTLAYSETSNLSDIISFTKQHYLGDLKQNEEID